MSHGPVIEIDPGSGFCFGVVTAIRKAEEELGRPGTLYCLGDIVHNAVEVERLRRKGLKTITHADLKGLKNAKVLLRAHGEPPSTYATSQANNIEVIDATCPVVLQLQRRIRRSYDEGLARRDNGGREPLIVIYGKVGHAEVNGLVGQTDGTALVVQDENDLDKIDFTRDIVLYSQTTKPLDGFRHIVSLIAQRKQGAFEWYDTICRQVANRMESIRDFAANHEVVLFVSGAKSSNGRVLCEACRQVNPRTYMVSDETHIDPAWLEGAATVGVTGATSTPLWLMQRVADSCRQL